MCLMWLCPHAKHKYSHVCQMERNVDTIVGQSCDLHAFLLKEKHKSVPIEGLVLSAQNLQDPLPKYVPPPRIRNWKRKGKTNTHLPFFHCCLKSRKRRNSLKKYCNACDRCLGCL